MHYAYLSKINKMNSLNIETPSEAENPDRINDVL